MITRLPPSVVSFLIVLGAYWVYALVAVPLIEPSADQVAAMAARGLPDDVPTEPYRALLAKYFPPGHWALDSPMVLESPQAMLLLKDWQAQDNGLVTLVPCALVFFPNKRQQGTAPTGAPIILEAPAGAVLKFAHGFDPARAQVGRFERGQLNGPITIRSGMNQPGPADDLLITTHDVQINETRIWTTADVTFRLGDSRGRGNNMEIRLLPAPAGTRHGAHSIDVGGVHWVELKRRVQVHLALGGRSALPGAGRGTDRPGRANMAAPASTVGPDEPPLRVTCAGPFHFDFVRRVATFEDHVDVHRLRTDAPSDTLSCQLLTVQFAQVPRQAEIGPGASAAGDTGKTPRTMTLREIVAEGDPVKVTSPAIAGQIRCRRLEYRPTERPDGLPEIKAAGPGQLVAAPAKNPAQRFRVTWSKNMALRRYRGEPVVSLWGQARLAVMGGGQFSADTMHVYLKTIPDQPPRSGQPNVVPDRMVALSDLRGARNVQIRSPLLTGAVEELQVWFLQRAAAAATSDQAGPVLGNGRAANTANTANRRRLPRAAYDLRGRLLKLKLAMTGSNTTVTNLVVDGDVRFHETRTARPGEKPLTVAGAWVGVDEADTPGTQMTIRGNPAAVSARGLALRGAEIRLDRGANRVWVDTPGEMTMPVNGDLRGLGPNSRPHRPAPGGQSGPRRAAAPVVPPNRLTVSWQKQMNFDGQTIQFDQGVLARDDHGWIRTDSLAVRLSRKILFGQASDTADVGVQQIDCRGGAILESQSMEGQNQVSVDHGEARDLSLNWATGAIRATGPGWVSSVRAGNRDPLRTDPSAAVATAPADRLQYLRINFDRAAIGNLHQRTLTFDGRIRAVYGPVDRWDERLEADNPDGAGPDDVLLSSDSLTVTQTRLGDQSRPNRGTFELEARGNARVEGRSFFARSERMRYAQSKDLLVLEGTGRANAHLWRETQVGAPRSEVAARTILFWRTDGRVRVDDARFLNFSQMGAPPTNQRAAGARPRTAPR